MEKSRVRMIRCAVAAAPGAVPCRAVLDAGCRVASGRVGVRCVWGVWGVWRLGWCWLKLLPPPRARLELAGRLAAEGLAQERQRAVAAAEAAREVRTRWHTRYSSVVVGHDIIACDWIPVE